MILAAAGTGTAAGGLLPGIALLVGGCGALIGGIAALKSAWRHKGPPDPGDLGGDYAARLWIDLLDRYEAAEQAKGEAERQRDDAAEAAAQAQERYEECNRERLSLLRERMDP